MDTIMTILGCRPEIIRLSRIIPKLDKVCNHILVHTGQNHDKNLSEIFFQDLGIRLPNYYMNAKGTLGEQIAIIMKETEKAINEFKPDKILILGDTNSGLSAYIAKRMGVKIFHMEAGTRCYDNRVPEETNRILIDNISDINLPYTPGSKENLLREGIDPTKIIVSGNPIVEVLDCYEDKILESRILEKLKLVEGGYFLSTFHRAETVDSPDRLGQVLEGLSNISKKYNVPVVCSIHPRTRSKLDDINVPEGLIFLKPMGFFDFVNLEQNAKVILSDSGTVCEEACILRVPHVIMRDSTERPETVRVGASVISTVDSSKIIKATETMINGNNDWEIPEGYNDLNVSDKIVKYLLGE
ncbi:hypothetical protein LCGC14_2148510 [marine sediment metagenome]|uniref:UDP-N-acetylglucosamine 2-epimerase domain-containing protein n=1 Tax=marine sediment metagenome TaxID=412755 RepID=A0A0F9G979_9ZZZZ